MHSFGYPRRTSENTNLTQVGTFFHFDSNFSGEVLVWVRVREGGELRQGQTSGQQVRDFVRDFNGQPDPVAPPPTVKSKYGLSSEIAVSRQAWEEFAHYLVKEKYLDLKGNRPDAEGR